MKHIWIFRNVKKTVKLPKKRLKSAHPKICLLLQVMTSYQEQWKTFLCWLTIVVTNPSVGHFGFLLMRNSKKMSFFGRIESTPLHVTIWPDPWDYTSTARLSN